MKHRDPSPAEVESAFLRHQAELAQAVSGRAELSVSIGLNRIVDEPLADRESILIAKLPDGAPEASTRHMRGQVDLAALALKHHDTELHQKHRPADARAGAMFDALEEVRLEALGGAQFPGMRNNLAQRHETAFTLKGYDHMREQNPVALPDVVAMLAREAITGDAPPPAIRTLTAMLRPLIEESAGEHLGKLARAVGSQTLFARITQDILYDLKLITHRPSQKATNDDGENDIPDVTGHEDEDGPEEENTPSASQTVKSSGDTDENSEGEQREVKAPTDTDMDADIEEDMREKAPRHTPNRGDFLHADTVPYHAFTTAYDEIIEADALASAEELHRLFETLMLKVKQYHTVTSRLATRLQRLLLAQQTRQWIYELEDGIIDNARLASIVSRPDTTTIYKFEKDTDFRDTVVTLLIDNSGSMRGRPITIAALSADILARTLERCGVKVEILGFTTRDWKGGFSRKSWLDAGRKVDPGRLNDLRHIIYKSADQRLNRARRNLGLMLKDGILKENIDGESILWAYNRLRVRREQRKILMVISDGAPVDDATLSANSGSYLDRHLREVIRNIERSGDVELLAVGIGHDVTRYYSRAVTLHDVEQLGDTMLQQITSLFAREDIRLTRKDQRRRAA
jgi:cobaltochelatase CobT